MHGYKTRIHGKKTRSSFSSLMARLTNILRTHQQNSSIKAHYYTAYIQTHAYNHAYLTRRGGSTSGGRSPRTSSRSCCARCCLIEITVHPSVSGCAAAQAAHCPGVQLLLRFFLCQVVFLFHQLVFVSVFFFAQVCNSSCDCCPAIVFFLEHFHSQGLEWCEIVVLLKRMIAVQMSLFCGRFWFSWADSARQVPTAHVWAYESAPPVHVFVFLFLRLCACLMPFIFMLLLCLESFLVFMCFPSVCFQQHNLYMRLCGFHRLRWHIHYHARCVWLCATHVLTRIKNYRAWACVGGQA